jgi:hypothetical protein
MSDRKWCESCGSLNLGESATSCHSCGHDVLSERVMLARAASPISRGVLAAGAIGLTGWLAACPPAGDVYGGPPEEEQDVVVTDSESADVVEGSADGSGEGSGS